MEIKNAEIKYFKKDGFLSESTENVTHVKILPYLSVVQSVEGSYDITLGNGKKERTGDGGFFIAPSGIQQTIVHHINRESKRMICRWLFIDVEINRAYKLDSLYQFPTVITDEHKNELNILFDELFESDDIWSNYSCCYKILGLLLQSSEPSMRKIDEGIQKAVAYLTENYRSQMSIKELAKTANMSESNFYAEFRRDMGSSPIAYLNRYRLSLAADRLTETNDTINEISYEVGINDPLYFSKLFKKTYSMTPKEYRLMHRKQI